MEDLSDYFNIKHKNDFMTVVQSVKLEKRNEIPAIVHVDETTRYQTVGKHMARYHKLIESFRNETDVPVLLNTSFNTRGQPIVCTPTEAIATYSKLDLDILVLENNLINLDF